MPGPGSAGPAAGDGQLARLVVDPATSEIGETDFFVTADGGEYLAGAGQNLRIDNEWTNDAPH